jgi:hypothetical protein
MPQNSTNQNITNNSALTQPGTPFNTSFGVGSVRSTVTGLANVGVGYQALLVLTTGSQNTGIGAFVLSALTTTSNNTGVGSGALTSLITGTNNSCFGVNAGGSYSGSESNNIIIGPNIFGTPGESNITRIGNGTTSCYLAGVAGVTVANQQVVTVNTSTGQLGSAAIVSAIIWSGASSATTIVTGNGYYANNASTAVAFTLPSSPTPGASFKIVGVAAGGWSIGQTGGQTIIYGNKSTTAGTGSLASSAIGDAVEILFAGGNTFVVLSSVGNLVIS